MRFGFIHTFAACLAVALPMSVTARQFEDTFGRTMEAELLAHWGTSTGMVQIKKDGKPLTVKISAFAEKDQKEILEWMTENPDKLAALIEPPASGEGVISGSKWYFLHRGMRPVLIEFKGAGALKKDGVASKSARWNINFDKAITMKWNRLPTHAFSTALIAGKVYADDRHKSLLVRLDRMAVKPTEATVKGKTFVLANVRNLESWTGNESDRTAIVEFKDGGKATVAGKEFEWTVAGGAIQLKHSTGFAAFGPNARDLYIDSNYNLLWEVAPPGKK